MDENSQRTPFPKEKRGLFGLLARPEGHILLTGCGLALLYFAWVGIQGHTSAEEFRLLVGMTATNVVFGRAAGMSFGYLAEQFHPVMVLVANMWIETTMVLFVYPLFVFSWEQLLVIRGLKRFMLRTRQAAEANQHLIRKYGMIGLFGFVWLPFWMTGPIVGAVIGYLMGLRPWVTMAIVLSGTYVATTIWAVVLYEMHERVAAYGAYAPLVILVTIMAMVAAGNLWQRYREKRKRHREKGDSV